MKNESYRNREGHNLWLFLPHGLCAVDLGCVGTCIKNLADGPVPYRVHGFGSYVSQGDEHEAPLGHSRMRNRQGRSIHRQFIIEKDVQIEGSRSVPERSNPPLGIFHSLTSPEQFLRCQGCCDLDRGIQKPWLVQKAYRLRLIKGRDLPHFPCRFVQENNGPFQIRLAIPEVRPGGQISQMNVTVTHRLGPGFEYQVSSGLTRPFSGSL